MNGDNGKENGNYYSIFRLYRGYTIVYWGHIGDILALEPESGRCACSSLNPNLASDEDHPLHVGSHGLVPKKHDKQTH